MKAARRTFLLIGLFGLAAIAGCTGGKHPPLTETEQTEFDTLTRQLSDPTRTAKTRFEAASLLLTRTYPQAFEAIDKFLSDFGNSAAQIAIADAIAARGLDREQFIKPLMDMLKGSDQAVRVSAARALTTYRDGGVIESLIELAMDRYADAGVRRDTITAMGRLVDKRSVEALVNLLEDSDPKIRTAAAESLANVTSIRNFGDDALRWRKWWSQNKDKKPYEWISDMAAGLARNRDVIQAENAQLRARLAKAMNDIYAATPPAQRDKMLLDMLRDPLPDIRTVAVKIAESRISNNEPLTEEHIADIRTMLSDESDSVRRAAAMLMAHGSDKESVRLLMNRLKVEQSPSVQEAILTALGQIRSVAAAGTVINSIDSDNPQVAGAAALALACIVEKQPLEEKDRDAAAEALIRRYRRNGHSSSEGVALRESLLTAMAVVGEKDFIPILEKALEDTNATVRLAAVKGLAKLGDEKSADVLIAIVRDEDRGVRQAAIAAIGSLDGRSHLKTILERTDPAVESAAGVRDQAWQVAMNILGQADADALADVIASLAGRSDAVEHRIEIMKILVRLLKSAKSPKLPDAQHDLGLALAAAGRPAEAAASFEEAYEFYAAGGSDKASQVWVEWTDAMLAADDPTAVKVIADQKDPSAFENAVVRLLDRLETLSKQKDWDSAVLLAEQAKTQLGGRLTAKQMGTLGGIITNAQQARKEADRQEVARLAAQLTNNDEAIRKAAVDKLKAMGAKAVKPLLDELQKTITAKSPVAAAEKAIVDVLAQIAPTFTGYNVDSPLADRVKVIEDWLAANGGR